MGKTTNVQIQQDDDDKYDDGMPVSLFREMFLVVASRHDRGLSSLSKAVKSEACSSYSTK